MFIRAFSLVVLSAGLLFGFQNCGRQFSAISRPVLASASCADKECSSVTFNPEELPPTCFFNGQVIADQQEVTAYLESTTTAECRSEQRKCENGKLSGSYTYASCVEQNIILPVKKSCQFDGQEVADGAQVTAYLASSASASSSCQSEKRICSDGVLSGSYSYATCEIQAPKSCLFNGETIPHKGFVTAYLNSAVGYGQKCGSEVRVCMDGVLSGSYQYASCKVDAPKSCLFQGKTIANGGQVIAYQASSVSFGQSCHSQVRTCANGALSGSYEYESCAADAPKACLFNGAQVAHGQEVIAYQKSGVPFGESCVAEKRLCDNGDLSGSYQYASCVKDAPKPCLFQGMTIPHGASVVAYKKASAGVGELCEKQTRVCSNGALSGSYTAKSCLSSLNLEATTFDPKDYLFEKVCVDSSGAALGVDPYLREHPDFQPDMTYHLYTDDLGNDPQQLARCTAMRNVAKNENFKYVRYDFFPKANYDAYRGNSEAFNKAAGVVDTGYSRSHSFPVAIQGKDFFVYTINYGNFPGGDSFDTLDNDDGFGLIDIDQDVVTAISSRDGVYSNGNNFYGPDGNGLGTWIYFPKTAPEFNRTNKYLMGRLAGGFKNGPPLNPLNGSLYIWTLPSYNAWERRPFTYTDGKTMDTIISYHWSTANPNTMAAMEATFFTKEYGLTRWEAWAHKTRYLAYVGGNGEIPALTPQTTCPGSNTNGDWVRIACADWTNVRVGNGVSARPFNGASFLLQNMKDHAARGVTDRARIAQLRSSALNGSSWQVYKSDASITTLTSEGSVLDFKCSHCSADSIYQDLSIQGGRTVTFGGELAFDQADYLTLANTDTYIAKQANLVPDGVIYLFEMSSSGQVLASQKLDVSLSDVMAGYDRSITLNPKTTKVRLTFYPNVSSVTFRIQSLFVSY